jgi:hypothetical protein
MNRILSVLLLSLLLGCNVCLGFQPPMPRGSVVQGGRGRVMAPSTTSLNVFGQKKKSAAQIEEEAKYWQGEWVCKDCGYIYNRVSRIVSFPVFSSSLRDPCSHD